MKNLKLYFTLFCTLTTLGLSSNITAQGQTPDGLYYVKQFCPVEADCFANSKSEVTLHLMDFSKEEQAIEGYVRLAVKDYVPIQLKEPPQKLPDDTVAGRSKLLITLTRKSGKKLKRFSKKHLNQTVAIVIGNKAVSKHGVKTVITGGKLQVSRCTDNGCEILFTELQDN